MKGANTVVDLPMALLFKFPLSFWKTVVVSTVALIFTAGLVSEYLTMSDFDYRFLNLPRTIQDLKLLRDKLQSDKSDYIAQVLVGYYVVHIFMQTFMILETMFMSLHVEALFGVFKEVALVVFTAITRASSCYFLSKMIGRPILSPLWPEKLKFLQTQGARRSNHRVQTNVGMRCFQNSL